MSRTPRETSSSEEQEPNGNVGFKRDQVDRSRLVSHRAARRRGQKLLRREEAQALVSELIERVHKLSKKWEVENVWAYGSYAREESLLLDVNILIESKVYPQWVENKFFEKLSTGLEPVAIVSKQFAPTILHDQKQVPITEVPGYFDEIKLLWTRRKPKRPR
jgi:predicted nucleotidyltransferase